MTKVQGFVVVDDVEIRDTMACVWVTADPNARVCR